MENLFSHSFTLGFCLSLKLRFICCRQQKDGFCFLIHSQPACVSWFESWDYSDLKLLLKTGVGCSNFFSGCHLIFILSFIICSFICLIITISQLCLFLSLVQSFISIVPYTTGLVDKNSVAYLYDGKFFYLLQWLQIFLMYTGF